MFSRVSILLGILVAGTTLAAQGGGGLTGAREPPPPTVGAPLTLAEQFSNQLKLDQKTQVPPVDEIIQTSSKEALEVAREMQKLRLQLVNAEIANNAADIKTTLDAYAAAAEKMTAIESKTFAKVYALLKPNQQSRAPEAFEIMAGMFVPPSPPAPRPGQRGGGGGGR